MTQLLGALRMLVSPRWPTLTGFGAFFFLGTFVFLVRDRPPSTAQPIAFNHAKHLEINMACTDCHQGAQSQAQATLPNLATCMTCHIAPLTQSAEEEKIRLLSAAGKELTWTQITRVPAHVYFSHRRHVELGRVDCATCHGPMEKATAPPRRAYRLLNMDACIECHRQRGAGTDCNDCHR
jgi:hypothetical protein